MRKAWGGPQHVEKVMGVGVIPPPAKVRAAVACDPSCTVTLLLSCPLCNRSGLAERKNRCVTRRMKREEGVVVVVVEVLERDDSGDDRAPLRPQQKRTKNEKK